MRGNLWTTLFVRSFVVAAAAVVAHLHFGGEGAREFFLHLSPPSSSSFFFLEVGQWTLNNAFVWSFLFYTIFSVNVRHVTSSLFVLTSPQPHRQSVSSTLSLCAVVDGKSENAWLLFISLQSQARRQPWSENAEVKNFSILPFRISVNCSQLSRRQNRSNEMANSQTKLNCIKTLFVVRIPFDLVS